jgi:hypothetical protein
MMDHGDRVARGHAMLSRSMAELVLRLRSESSPPG